LFLKVFFAPGFPEAGGWQFGILGFAEVRISNDMARMDSESMITFDAFLHPQTYEE